MHKAPIIGGAAAMAAAAGLGGSAVASGAGKPPHKRAFTAVVVGARISASGNRFENIYRVKRSPDGGGAAIQDGVLLGSTYPVAGNDTMKLFYADGVQHTSDTFTLAAPHIDGLGAITGKGTCTTGSAMHQGETCTYTFTGTYDLNTGVTMLHLSGTFTR